MALHAVGGESAGHMRGVRRGSEIRLMAAVAIGRCSFESPSRVTRIASRRGVDTGQGKPGLRMIKGTGP